jgi:CIC family chloride channel protein
VLERSRQFFILVRLRKWLAEQFRRLRMTEHTFMVILAVIIGVLGGFGAILFRFAIRFFHGAFFGTWDYSLAYVLHLPWYVKLLAPVIGGVIVGPIVYSFAREARGHGVPEVMEAIVLRSGAIRPRVMVAKIVASAVSIAAGGSVGREGPIVQIGSALGSVTGQLVKVTGSRLRTLVGCGAAAGIAATFNAPVAGALFAVEIILGDFGVSQFSPIVISSVAATVVSRHFLGNFPAFRIPQYELVSVFEMLPYAILGILAAFVSVAFIVLLYRTEDLFEKIPVPGWVKPAIGGGLIGAVGIQFPHIFGVGYDTISLALEGKLVWHFLLFLVGLKIMATSVSIGSGMSGGIFAPSLFMGASLGGFVGSVVQQVMPASSAGPGAYALVGMGAVVAGATHAPITAILIIFELTSEYQIILPLMVACILSTLIATRLKRDSIYTLKLSRRGVDLFQGREINVLRSIPVEKVMRQDYEVVRADASFKTLMDLTVTSHHTSFFVTDRQNRLQGLISVHDIRKILYDARGLEQLLIAHDLMTRLDAFLVPGDTLDIAMQMFGRSDLDELPVLDSSVDRHLIGTVTRHDVIEAYNREILKRDMASSVSSYLRSLQKVKSIELMDGHWMVEMEVPGPFVNKTLRELDLRRRYGVEVVLIRKAYDPERGEEHRIETPQPDTRLEFGDILLLVGPRNKIEDLQNL